MFKLTSARFPVSSHTVPSQRAGSSNGTATSSRASFSCLPAASLSLTLRSLPAFALVLLGEKSTSNHDGQWRHTLHTNTHCIFLYLKLNSNNDRNCMSRTGVLIFPALGSRGLLSVFTSLEEPVSFFLGDTTLVELRREKLCGRREKLCMKHL